MREHLNDLAVPILNADRRFELKIKIWIFDLSRRLHNILEAGSGAGNLLRPQISSLQAEVSLSQDQWLDDGAEYIHFLGSVIPILRLHLH